MCKTKYFWNELSYKQEIARHDAVIADLENRLVNLQPEDPFYKTYTVFLSKAKDSRVDVVNKIGRNGRKKK